MAKRGSLFKKLTNLSKKTGKGQNFCIGDFSFSSINTLDFLPEYAEIKLMFCSLAVVITLLCQVSAIRLRSSFAGNIDVSDTFKLWKSRYFRTDLTLFPVVCASVIKSFSFLTENSADEITSLIIAMGDNVRGSQPFIKNCTPTNQARWREGYMARTFGILNSCPATNMDVFNLSPDTVESLTIDGVLKMIPIKDKPSVEEVRERIRNTIFSAKKDPISLNEPVLPGSGLTSLEAELFDPSEYFRFPTANPQAPPSTREFDIADIQKALSDIQLKKYLNAIEVGNRQVIFDMLSIVRDYKESGKVTPDAAKSISERVNKSLSSESSSVKVEEVSTASEEEPADEPIVRSDKRTRGSSAQRSKSKSKE